MQGPNDGLPKFRCMWSDFRTSPPALIHLLSYMLDVDAKDVFRRRRLYPIALRYFLPPV